MMDGLGRNQFAFKYTAEELLTASEQKLSHHKQRLDHWKGQLYQREQKLRDNGIEFTTVIKAGKLSNSTQYYNNGINIDPDLKREYDEAAERVQTHADAVDDFERWVRAFTYAKLTKEVDRFQLTVSDVEYFNL